jgi:hypothetical protein
LGDSEIADAVRLALPLQTKHVERVASASLDLAASEDPDEEASRGEGISARFADNTGGRRVRPVPT